MLNKERHLVALLIQSYRTLGLGYGKLVLSILFMFLNAVFEMVGLGLLYPLIKAISDTTYLNDIAFFAPMPFAQQIAVLSAIIATAFVLKNSMMYVSYTYNIKFTKLYYRELIQSLYRAYLAKPLLRFQKESSGAMSHIICVESARLVDSVVRPLFTVLAEVTLLLGVTAFVIWISPVLIATVGLCCGSVLFIYYRCLRHKAESWGLKRQKEATNLQELVSNSFAGITEIKIFGREKFLTNRVYDAAVNEANMYHHLEMYQQGPRLIIEAAFVMSLLLFVSGTFLWSAGEQNILVQFSIVCAAAFRLLPSLNRIINSYSIFSFNVGSSTNLMHKLSDDLLVADATQGQFTTDSVDAVKRIDVVGVAFEYDDKAVLQGVDATFEQGQKVGIVGKTGSGKSTLIKLLAGLYTPSAGLFRVNGQDRALDSQYWRACIGYVPQHAFIFPGTVKENIAFGQKTSEAAINAILDKLGARALVEALPNGLETMIGEKSIRLSGGQRQIICLARALCGAPRVLLLDEPTASLDAFNESIVMEAIERLSEETITIMISHKYENFQRFDKIYYCYDGQLHQTSDVDYRHAAVK